jgi:hypothetical protein
VTKKIWVTVSIDNQGYIERCDECGVTQPDSATSYRQLHYDDCSIAPPPVDLLERMEELSRPRSEEVDRDVEKERVRRAQELRALREQEIQTAKRAMLDQKIREGKVIPITQSSDPNWKIKEQIGFLESAIKGRSLQFLHLQIDWASNLLASGGDSVDPELNEKLIQLVNQASELTMELVRAESK